MPTEPINPEGDLIEAAHLSAEGNRDTANLKGALTGANISRDAT